MKKDFVELKVRKLKDREIQIKTEVQDLFFKPIIVSLDDKDKFEQKEMKKIRAIKDITSEENKINGIRIQKCQQ